MKAEILTKKSAEPAISSFRVVEREIFCEAGIFFVKNICDEEQSTNIAHKYLLDILTVYISRSFFVKSICEPKIVTKTWAVIVKKNFVIHKNQKLYWEMNRLLFIANNPHKYREILTNICMRELNPDRRSKFL